MSFDDAWNHKNTGTVSPMNHVADQRDEARLKLATARDALRAIRDWGMEPDADYQRLSWADVAANALEATA